MRLKHDGAVLPCRAGGVMPERPAFATFHDGANVMYIIDAIVKSHQQQRWVRVQA